MTSQEQDQAHVGFGLQPARREKVRPGPHHDDNDDLGLSASNRTVSITLVIGVGLMLLVLLLPYLSGL